MKDDAVYLDHILECVAAVRRYTAGGREQFFADDMARNAVLRVLQTLAESTQRLSDEAKTAAPEVPWAMISGFRNQLVHNYLGIDDDAVWSVIEHDLDPLEAAARRLRSEEGT